MKYLNKTLIIMLVIILAVIILSLNFYSRKLWAWYLLITVILLIVFPFIRKKLLQMTEDYKLGKNIREEKGGEEQEPKKERKRFKLKLGGFIRKKDSRFLEDIEKSYEKLRDNLGKKEK
ncbi:MAG: hypothetical protein ABIE94_03170 [archaeon]